MESEPKRQRIELVQYLLNLDEEKFHTEFLHRISSVARQSEKDWLRARLYRKLEALQSLVYSEKPHPQSPQVYEELVISAPEVAQLQIRDSKGGVPWTIRCSFLDSRGDEDEDICWDMISRLQEDVGEDPKEPRDLFAFKTVTVRNHSPKLRT